MDKIRIGDKLVGKGEPCFIIAEAGVNHNGELDLAFKLVDVAKEAGADAVKFQTFKTENLVTREASKAEYQKENIGKEEGQFKMLKKLELKLEDFQKLERYCAEKGIIFMSTPHSPDVIDYLDNLMPAFKIGSGDLTNIPFLIDVAKKGKPIILSTGMGTMKEIKEACEAIKKHNEELIILHCTTNYPTKREECNLNVMKILEKETGCLIGYSDHTEGIEIPLMAAKLGAVVIEKHFTLDKEMEGPDHKASLNPAELKEMVKGIRGKQDIDIPEEIMGTGEKIPTEKEMEIAKIARKSIIAATDLHKGTEITEEMLIIKRPGTGIKPKHLDEVIGKKAKEDIRQDELIRWEQLE